MVIILMWIALGVTSMYNTAPSIIASFGWRGVWWFTAIYSFIFLILWALFLRNTDAPKNQETGGAAEKLPFDQVLKNLDVWVITLVNLLFMISLQGVQIFLTTYLTQFKGLDTATATRITGLIGLIGLVTLILAGAISDKLQSRKWLTVVLMIISGGICALIPSSFSPVLVIVLIGIFANMVPPLVFTAASEVVEDPRTIGLAMGMVTSGQSIGLFLSSVLFGMFVDSSGGHQLSTLLQLFLSSVV